MQKGLISCTVLQTKALKNKSCRARGKALRHHTSVTGLPQQHICPTPLLPVPLQCSSRVLLLPSTQPSLDFKGHLLPHDTCTPSKSSLLRHLPAARSSVQRQITPKSLLLLTVSVQHSVQMGRRHQMRVTLSPVLRGRADAGVWPSALHSTRPCCVQCPLLFSKDIWTLRGLGERLKAGSALQLLSLCLPASLQGRVQQHPQNWPVFCLRKRKINLQQARAFVHSCPTAAKRSSGLHCSHLISSVPNCSNSRSIRLKYCCTLGFPPALACRSNTGDECRLRTRAASCQLQQGAGFIQPCLLQTALFFKLGTENNQGMPPAHGFPVNPEPTRWPCVREELRAVARHSLRRWHGKDSNAHRAFPSISEYTVIGL